MTDDAKPIDITSRIIDGLLNKEYRDGFMQIIVRQSIATQIRDLRRRDGISQEQLAFALKTGQTQIARLENPETCRPSVNTLLKIAQYFEVALVIRFVGWPEFMRIMVFTPVGEVKGFSDDQLSCLLDEEQKEGK